MQKIAFHILFLIFLPSICAGQISVKQVDSLNHPMVDSVVRQFAGEGVSIFDVRSNLKSSNPSTGSFKSHVSGFAFSSGLVMSSGRIDSIPKTNRLAPMSSRISYADTQAGASLGRQLLQKVLSQNTGTGLPQKITDVASIQFKIVPNGDSLSFRYIFASEEYPEFVCSQFNDIFGFFIKGPGISGDQMFAGTSLEGFRNLSRLPGNGLPVSINTVNSGISGPGGDMANCQMTPEGISRFIDNGAAGSSLFHQIGFDGLTKVMTARTAVQSCQIYQLVLVVGDAGDRLYDSGVFLEKGSLVSDTYHTQVEKSNHEKDTLSICHPVKIRFLRCPNIQDKWTIRFRWEGNAIPNEDFKVSGPGGELQLVPDSVVLEPGQGETMLQLVAIKKGFDPKELVIKHLNLLRPYSQGQPQYSGQETRIPFRGDLVRPVPNPEICWKTTGAIPFQGIDFPHLQYGWEAKTETGWTALTAMGDNRNFSTPMDTADKQLRVRIVNTENQCQKWDTLLVKGKPFYIPVVVAETTGLAIQDPVEGYVYKWETQSGPIWGNEIEWVPGTLVGLEIKAPNGCRTETNPMTLMHTGPAPAFAAWKVYPNPAGPEIQIESTDHMPVDWLLCHLNGQVLSKGSGVGTCKINLLQLPPGQYILSMRKDNGRWTNRRFQKK